MDHIKTLAKQIVEKIGGPDNVASIAHCATRIRVHLKDEKLFQEEAVKQIDGVFGISQAGTQHQIIVGPKVSQVYNQIVNLYHLEGEGTGISEPKTKFNIRRSFGNLLEFLAGCMAPLVPALSASGFVKIILVILSMANLLPTTSQTYYILDFASDAVFYFMPFLLAYTTAKKLGCNRILAMLIAGILLHPNFIKLVATGKAVHFVGLPVTLTSYAASVVPIIFSVWIMSWLEKLVYKVIPEFISSVLNPFLILLIMTPVVLVFSGPLGVICGQGLAVGVQAMSSTVGWLAIGLLCFFSPFIAMTGMHLALIPISVNSIGSKGYDSIVLIWFLCNTLAQGAAALAVFFKTKNHSLKQIAGSAAICGIFGGISEPALYGVNMKLKKPMYAAMISSAVGGVFAGLVHLKAFAFCASSILSLPSYYSAKFPTNFMFSIIAVVISMGLTFILTYIFGFDDSVYVDKEAKAPKA